MQHYYKIRPHSSEWHKWQAIKMLKSICGGLWQYCCREVNRKKGRNSGRNWRKCRILWRAYPLKYYKLQTVLCGCIHDAIIVNLCLFICASRAPSPQIIHCYVKRSQSVSRNWHMKLQISMIKYHFSYITPRAMYKVPGFGMYQFQKSIYFIIICIFIISDLCWICIFLILYSVNLMYIKVYA